MKRTPGYSSASAGTAASPPGVTRPTIGSPLTLPSLSLARRQHDTVHENARRDDGLRVEAAHRHDRLDLGDGDARGGCHHRVEVAAGLAVDEIAPRIGALGADQREVSAQTMLEEVHTPAELALLLALGERRADAGRRVERRDARAAGAD